MSAKHTPGPWVVCTDDRDMLSVEQDRELMEAAGNYEEPSVIVGCVEDMGEGIDREIGEANARLIAAAPEMLAACKAALAFIRPSVEDEECEGREGAALALNDQLAAAIAKAEGRDA